MKKWILIPCLAMAVSLGSSMVSLAAVGWSMENGEWSYFNRDGSKVTDALKKSGDRWFYLDGDGKMAKNQLVENNENYYYMDSNGSMVTDKWMKIDNESPSDGEPDQWWYYFQSNGKAVKKSSSGVKPRFVTLPTQSGKAKFAFDDQGHMLSGWVGENGEMLTDDEAWKNGMYYLGDHDNGRLTTGWKYLEAANDEDKDREGNGYWFFFKNNGEKTVNIDNKKINGKKYRFNEYGAAHFEWYNKPGTATGSNATPSDANRYYNNETETWLATGWFKTVPSEEVDEKAHSNDEAFWFYADKNGELIKSQIKTIKGQKYGFNDKGEMLHGLYKITFEEDGKTFSQVEKIEAEADLPKTSEKDAFIYYFGDSPKEGAMKTGDTTLELDGENYRYRFKKSGANKGSGVDGIEDGKIYIMGKLLKADQDAKYEVFTYEGKDYLVNTSGSIAKDKKNIKDSDDTYYCTDKKGVVIYKGTEKFGKK